jgi:membrane-anchored protein YejM (alkaline phosphatase superfamily)
MAQSNGFLTPRLNGLKYFRKATDAILGHRDCFQTVWRNEFTARLYTLLCALGCIALIRLHRYPPLWCRLPDYMPR